MVRWITLLIAAIVSASPAFSQTTQDDPFAKGKWEFTLSGAYTTHIRFSQAHTYQLNAEIGKYFWDNWSLGGELQGIYAEQPDDHDVIIGGIGLIGRIHFLRFDKWSVFFDGGGSVTFGDNTFPTYPVEGTHFNFTGKAGFGATYRLKGDAMLIGGVRYFHLSNGQIHGADQNPTYDSIQFWGGLMWSW